MWIRLHQSMFPECPDCNWRKRLDTWQSKTGLAPAAPFAQTGSNMFNSILTLRHVSQMIYIFGIITDRK
jgi:hypothetical protein